MGTINATIPLMFNPAPQVQPVSPMATIGGLMQARGELSRIALQNAQIEQAKQQSADIAAQTAQRNRELADQNTIQAIQKDPAAAKRMAAADMSDLNGKVSPAALAAQTEKANAAIQARATADKTTLENHSAALGRLGKDFNSAIIQNYRPDGSFDPQAATSHLQDYYNSHTEELRIIGADSSKLPTMITDEDHAKQLAGIIGVAGALNDAALAYQKTKAETAKDQATADLTTAQVPGAQAKSTGEQLATAAQQLSGARSAQEYGALLDQLPHGVATRFPAAASFDPKTTPAAVRALGMTPEQQTTVAQKTAEDVEAARHNRATEATTAAELGVRRAEADPFGALGINPRAVPNPGQGLTGEAYLKTLPPQLQPIVHQIATGQQAPISGFALTKPYGQQIMAAVAQYDPTFSADRANERKAFSSGKQGQNIQALNTATVHLDQLKDAAAALNNHTLVPGNQLYNTIAQTFGAAAPTNFEALKNVAAGELANAYKGAATDEEIRNISKTITAAQSPQQLAGTLQTQLHALGAKLNTYDEQYHQKIPNDTFSPVLPTARAVFEKNGIKPLSSDASDWKTTAQQAKAGDTISLPNGHKAKKNADGTFTQLTQ